MQYAPCRYCEEVTAVDRGHPVCGSCELIMGNSNQQSEQDLVREEDQDWEADTDQAETDLLEEEVRRQMAEDDQRLYRDRLRGSSNEALFRSVYLDGSNDENEEELYENDQDDFNFDMSYQDNIQAIRDQLSNRQFDLALDRAAIVQRLLRIFVNNEEGLQDDASQAKGATEADISTLKTRTLSLSLETDDQGTECAICTEKFQFLELTQLPCNHEYHSKCIHHWLKLNASCPMCRQSIFKSIDEQPQQQEEPDLIIIRRETADRLRQTDSPMSFMDDVD